MRLREGKNEILDGTGFAIFDDHHALVRRGTGTLLGGWYRHATVEDDGWLFREDLATGARTLLGSAARVVCEPDVEAIVLDAIREGRHDAVAALREGAAAIEGERDVVAIPGTRNVLEITETMYRVV